MSNKSETISEIILIALYDLLTNNEKGRRLIANVIDAALIMVHRNRIHLIEEQNEKRTEEIS